MEQFWNELKAGILVDLISKFSTLFPRLIFALIVFLVGWMLAKIGSGFLGKVLKSLKVDVLGDKLNEIDFMQANNIKIKISSILCQFFYYFLVLIFIVAATDVLGVKVISDFVGSLINYLPKLLTALVMLMIGVFVSDLISKAVRTTCESLGIPSAKIISLVVFYLLLITISISALAQADIDTSFLASNITVIIGAGALAFSIGYGLASRDLVSNYLASFYNRNKVRIGDEVVMEGVKGKVVLLDTNSIVLQTTDSAVIFPLSKLATQKVEIIYPEGQEDRLISSGN